MKSELKKKKSNFPKLSSVVTWGKKIPSQTKSQNSQKIKSLHTQSSAQRGCNEIRSFLQSQALGRGHFHTCSMPKAYLEEGQSPAPEPKQPVSVTPFASLYDPSEKIYLICTCIKNRVTWYQNNVRHTGKLWSTGGAFWHKAGELCEIMGTPVVAKGKCQAQNLLTEKCLLTLLAYFLDKYGLWN